MDLQIKFPGITDKIDAHSVKYIRKLGGNVEYQVLLLLNYGNRNNIELIANQLKNKETKITVSWKGQPILEDMELYQCTYIDNAEPRLLLACLKNKYAHYSPGAFTTRKRVLKGADMREIFRNYFADLVELDDNVEDALAQVKFPEKGKTNIIQYCQTDDEMMRKILNWYNHTCEKKDTLMISGNAQKDKKKFQLSFVQPAKCSDLNYSTSRKLENNINTNWDPYIRIGYQEMKVPEIYKSHLAAQNVVYIVDRGEFNQGTWSASKETNVPAFYKDKFVYEVWDILTDARVGNLGWETWIATIPHDEELNVPSQDFAPWTGIGHVKKRSETEKWMEVEIAEFEKEKNGNVLDVRLTTSYSGHDENAGFHLVPEQKSEVAVHKTSNWKDPILLLGNVRSKNVTEKAPFWKLEDTAKWDFKTLDVKLKDVTTTAEETITMKISGGVTAKINSSEMDIS